MSHNLTLPEEIEIVLMELEESEIINEKTAIKNSYNKDRNGWSAGYVPPYRAVHQNKLDNSKSES